MAFASPIAAEGAPLSLDSRTAATFRRAGSGLNLCKDSFLLGCGDGTPDLTRGTRGTVTLA
jgi:hypothetical protein